MPSVRDLGLAELVVERRGTEPLVIAIILDGRASGRRGLRGGSKPRHGQEGATEDAGEDTAGWVHGGQLITGHCQVEGVRGRLNG